MSVLQAKLWNVCKKCGLVAYKGYPSGLGLTLLQLEERAAARERCRNCSGPARPATLDELRTLGLDGFGQNDASAACLLGFIKER